MDGVLTAQLLKTVVKTRGSTDGIKVILVAAADATPVAYCGGPNGCYQSALTGTTAYKTVSDNAITTVETSMWFAMGRSAPGIVSGSMPDSGMSVWGTPKAAFTAKGGNGFVDSCKRRYGTPSRLGVCNCKSFLGVSMLPRTATLFSTVSVLFVDVLCQHRCSPL